MVPGTDVFADSNFAPVINADGSLVALERKSVIAASHWRDVSSYKRVGTFPDAGEDPYVWKDARGIYHSIVHVGRNNTHGLHYYSTDGLSWVVGAPEEQAYNSTISYTDGTQEVYACRERPHIVQDRDGNVLGLTNGAAASTCHTAGGDDYAFTAFQAVLR
jgi:hypothetical protein